MNTDRQLILGPTGRQLFKIGGDNAWRNFDRDPTYNVSIEWHTDGKTCEPVMCIWPKIGGSNAPVLAICLSSAFLWGDTHGGPARGAMLRALDQLVFLNRDVSLLETRKLLDVVMRHLPDLLNCPPMPPAMRQAEAGEALIEMTVKDENGRTLNEAVI